MRVWPLKFREMEDGGFLFADDAGGFFRSDEAFLDRYARDVLNPCDHRFLLEAGHAYLEEQAPSFTSFAYRWASRQSVQAGLSYVILVPTLRCNLSCRYCQVSRAAERAAGYDWTEETLSGVLAFLDRIDGEQVKVEFQGGEPLLRVDLLDRVRTFCRKRFKNPQFVVCTNLQRLGPTEWAFLDAADTFVSTSLDGDLAIQERQRTRDSCLAEQFFHNLEEAIARFGPSRVSALPTIDIDNPPNLSQLVDVYERFGISSIYLRPINHQGFARRKSPASDALARWNALHSEFIELLIGRNHRTGRVIEEYYFTHCLRRVLRSGMDGHVDLRNPNFFASDYLVVDYDGLIYPTDEARMLSRIGYIDLSIGDVWTGVDEGKVSTLNAASLNNFDPDCIHCPYQPYCGTDLVDDISRYGRVDRPRLETWFCGRHMAVFDKIFEVIYRDDEKTRFSLSQWAGVSSWPRELSPAHT